MSRIEFEQGRVSWTNLDSLRILETKDTRLVKQEILHELLRNHHLPKVDPVMIKLLP